MRITRSVLIPLLIGVLLGGLLVQPAAALTTAQVEKQVLDNYVGPVRAELEILYDAFVPSHDLVVQDQKLTSAQAALDAIGDTSEDADIALVHQHIAAAHAAQYLAYRNTDDARGLLITRILPRVETACGCTYP